MTELADRTAANAPGPHNNGGCRAGRRGSRPLRRPARLP